MVSPSTSDVDRALAWFSALDRGDVDVIAALSTADKLGISDADAAAMLARLADREPETADERLALSLRAAALRVSGTG